jgi:hypothetical protein
MRVVVAVAGGELRASETRVMVVIADRCGVERAVLVAAGTGLGVRG